jgi:hypothetical protein
MKRDVLIELLKTLPEDAEVVVSGYSCEILGEYTYEDNFNLNKVVAYGRSLQKDISNYRGVDDEEKIVYALENW